MKRTLFLIILHIVIKLIFYFKDEGGVSFSKYNNFAIIVNFNLII
jgi:hypothetical protein